MSLDKDTLKGKVKFHHLGIAVKDFRKSINFYSNLGYEGSAAVVDDGQEAELVMLRSEHLPHIELIKPLYERSHLNNLLKTRSEAIYHMCYEVDDLEDVLGTLRKDFKVTCLKEQKQAVLFDGRNVSFYYVDGVGIVEFLER